MCGVELGCVYNSIFAFREVRFCLEESMKG